MREDNIASPVEELFPHPKHGPEYRLERRPDGFVKLHPGRGGKLAAELSGLFTSTHLARKAVELYKTRTDPRFARGEKEM